MYVFKFNPFSHPVFREPPQPCLRTSEMRCVCLHNSETTKATHMVGTVPRHNAELENTSRKFSCKGCFEKCSVSITVHKAQRCKAIHKILLNHANNHANHLYVSIDFNTTSDVQWFRLTWVAPPTRIRTATRLRISLSHGRVDSSVLRLDLVGCLWILFTSRSP